jgi:hypothetical protein
MLAIYVYMMMNKIGGSFGRDAMRWAVYDSDISMRCILLVLLLEVVVVVA